VENTETILDRYIKPIEQGNPAPSFESLFQRFCILVDTDPSNIEVFVLASLMGELYPDKAREAYSSKLKEFGLTFPHGISTAS